MKCTLRTYLALSLALLLSLTSQTMATARGAPTPVGQAILCTGSGPVTILVDAEGQPTGQTHICPDCAFSVLDSVIPPSIVPIRLSQSTVNHVIDIEIEILRSAPTAFAARAPPEVV
jgi:hypothetical protein